MSPVYLETSAVLSWLFGEAQAKKAAKYIFQSELVLTSALTRVEVMRSINRVKGLDLINAAEAQRLRGLYDRTEASWNIMNLHDPVLQKALEPFPVEPVRTLDAIHLASALIFIEAYPDLEILSFDQRIIENANQLGLIIN